MEEFARQRLNCFSFYLRKAIGHIILVLFLIHVCIRNRGDAEFNMEDPLSIYIQPPGITWNHLCISRHILVFILKSHLIYGFLM